MCSHPVIGRNTHQIITPTSRLAYYLNHTQREKNAISQSDWLDQLWLSCAQTMPEWKRLTSLQSTLLWQEIIEKEELPLLNTKAVIAGVQQAWQWLQQWKIPLSELKKEIEKTSEQKNLSDMAYFFNWASTYESFCTEKKWVDEYQLPCFLTQHMSVINTSASLQFYGFNYITPQFKALFAYLESKGMIIQYEENADIRSPDIHYYQYPDQMSEWRAAAVWAYECSKTSDATIGIVIPELSQSWLSIQSIFSEVFMPESVLSGETEKQVQFNLDAGLPFQEYPLVHHTLNLLKSFSQSLSCQEMSVLIRSVFLKREMEERSVRAQLTAKWIQQDYQYLTWKTVEKYLITHSSIACPLLSELAVQLNEKRQSWPEEASPSEWVLFVSAIFETIDWPNGREQNETEQQIWKRFLKVMSDLAGLDSISPSISYSVFLNRLEEELSNICFQPETKPALVQVMGILETLGMSFDHLWVCGLHEQSWPPAAKPNPFIPQALQRHYALPHATYRQEWTYAEQLTEHWCRSSSHLYFSYALAGEQHYLPSPLIESKIKTIEVKETVLPSWLESDHKIPPAISDEQGTRIASFKGGTALLKDQAECPFRAYAYYRLGLKYQPFDSAYELGNAAMRGEVIHRALELLWTELKDQKTLLALSESELKEIINAKVKKSLTELYASSKEKNAIPAVFLEIEQERVCFHIDKWLQKEKQRADFSIAELESKIELDLDGIIIRMRMDRIDKTSEGQVIIDYKTGHIPSLSQDSDRLLNPQLPLYAMSQSDVVGVTFAKIMGEFTGFSGWVAPHHANDFPALTRNALIEVGISDQISEWKTKADILINEFKNGSAKVDPYPNESACRYCDLHSLCRIGHSSIESVEEDDYV